MPQCLWGPQSFQGAGTRRGLYTHGSGAYSAPTPGQLCSKGHGDGWGLQPWNTRDRWGTLPAPILRPTASSFPVTSRCPCVSPQQRSSSEPWRTPPDRGRWAGMAASQGSSQSSFLQFSKVDSKLEQPPQNPVHLCRAGAGESGRTLYRP